MSHDALLGCHSNMFILTCIHSLPLENDNLLLPGRINATIETFKWTENGLWDNVYVAQWYKIIDENRFELGYLSLQIVQQYCWNLAYNKFISIRVKWKCMVYQNLLNLNVPDINVKRLCYLFQENCMVQTQTCLSEKVT